MKKYSSFVTQLSREWFESVSEQEIESSGFRFKVTFAWFKVEKVSFLTNLLT